ncbi:GNAT family N-acetyltransferase [Allomuricauda sp. SCSIO 65647]|uniref:GNAT family N-acetyltransferase n=1 Tax=Allomuricauda sp. SCSIO 65647 TaxID=2908843 RepID=UPI001F3D28AE|nr:GNAT family N-acetyltransferase [Muricauda sp. SCSIO 65647]UJH67629.1 GNAT family N-acetyltransferase [Muricauda sp. SCSIO 65647]
MVDISRASARDIPTIVPLFDAYRVFYGQESNLDAAHSFLLERFSDQDNIIFLALHDDMPIGFVQLYKTFSSVSLRPYYILNDLFVKKEFRKKGVGEALLEKAKSHCRQMDYKGLALETATDNPAKKLYEKLNWKKSTEFFHYFWSNPDLA